jgi:hypothetical protein
LGAKVKQPCTNANKIYLIDKTPHNKEKRHPSEKTKINKFRKEIRCKIMSTDVSHMMYYVQAQKQYDIIFKIGGGGCKILNRFALKLKRYRRSFVSCAMQMCKIRRKHKAAVGS